MINFITTHWISLLCISALFLLSAYDGYSSNKMAPAAVIFYLMIMFAGFGCGAAVKGMVDFFK